MLLTLLMSKKFNYQHSADIEGQSRCDLGFGSCSVVKKTAGTNKQASIVLKGNMSLSLQYVMYFAFIEITTSVSYNKMLWKPEDEKKNTGQNY